MRVSLGELAGKFGCELIGDPGVEVSSVSTLAESQAGSITFLANSAYKDQLRSTAASAVVVRAGDADDCPVAALIADDPYLTYARIATVLYPAKSFTPGAHPSAVISTSAQIADSAHIAAHVVIEDDVTIGENVFVGAGSLIGDRCQLGDESRLIANVSLVQDVTIGRRTIVHPGAVLGADGFGNAQSASGWVKVPQIGGVRIGDDVEIGANTTIDRGTIGDTVIANGVRLDNLIQIAHNVQIGEHTALAATVGISGSVIIGKRCLFAGRAGVSGHVTICDDVIVGAAAVVTKDITEPGLYSSFFAAEPDKSWKRKVARFRRIESLNDRVKQLEKAAKKNDG
jgi:UDP-3-O-[3-hydroxymyristoyl] glucosamine N-acyltransferase